MNGIAAGLTASHKGDARYKLFDDNGVRQKLKICGAIFVPHLHTRIILPQYLMQTMIISRLTRLFVMGGYDVDMTIPDRYGIVSFTKYIPIDMKNNILLFLVYFQVKEANFYATINVVVTSDSNKNPSPLQKMLLDLHRRLWNYSMKKLFLLAVTIVIPASFKDVTPPSLSPMLGG